MKLIKTFHYLAENLTKVHYYRKQRATNCTTMAINTFLNFFLKLNYSINEILFLKEFILTEAKYFNSSILAIELATIIY